MVMSSSHPGGHFGAPPPCGPGASLLLWEPRRRGRALGHPLWGQAVKVILSNRSSCYEEEHGRLRSGW